MTINARLDRLLQSFVDAGVPGCALAVSYRGEIVYTGYCGFANVEERRKTDENTLYRIASCTKNITATAVMRLFEDGKLLLNDPVSEYLPSFQNIPYQVLDGSGEIVRKATSRPLTIKDLLTMTAGIPYMGNGTPTSSGYSAAIGSMFSMYALTLQELAEKISQVPLESDPGTRWRYGLSYDVLAAIVEVISGKKYSAYLKEEIFDPLEMRNTSFYFDENQRKNLASVYRLEHGKPVDIQREPNITKANGNKLESGGGGLLSTLGDLVKFAGMWGQGGKWKGRRILSRNTIDLMRMNHLTGEALEDFRRMSKDAYPWYAGYGWGLAGRTLMSLQEAGSNGSLGEFGWCGAYGPYILADPVRELGIAYTQQMAPVIGGMQDYCHPRVRNAVYSMLDDWDETR